MRVKRERGGTCEREEKLCERRNVRMTKNVYV